MAIPSATKPPLKYKKHLSCSSDILFSTPLLEGLNSLGDAALNYMISLDNLGGSRGRAGRAHCLVGGREIFHSVAIYHLAVGHSLAAQTYPISCVIVYVRVYMCVCVWVCVCGYICVCVCLYVWVYSWELNPECLLKQLQKLPPNNHTKKII